MNQVNWLANYSNLPSDQIVDTLTKDEFNRSSIPREFIHVSEYIAPHKSSVYEIFYKENTYYIFEVKKSNLPFLWLPSYSVSSVTSKPELPSLDVHFLEAVTQQKYSDIFQNSGYTITTFNLAINIELILSQEITLETAKQTINDLLKESAQKDQSVQEYYLPYQIDISLIYKGKTLYKAHKPFNDTSLFWSN